MVYFLVHGHMKTTLVFLKLTNSQIVYIKNWLYIGRLQNIVIYRSSRSVRYYWLLRTFVDLPQSNILLFPITVDAEPLGLDTGEVSGNYRIKANSWYRSYYGYKVQLYNDFGWQSSITQEEHFLQVDFFSRGAIITGIATRCSESV